MKGLLTKIKRIIKKGAVKEKKPINCLSATEEGARSL